ncbi:fatty acid cis/trans isomerase [Methylosoma difficile]
MLRLSALKSILFFIFCGCLLAAYWGLFNRFLPKPPSQLARKNHTLILSDFTHKSGQISFSKDVKPILDTRCVACHAGEDAPCQLQLSSYDGLARGLSKQPVYDNYRLNAAPPSRLFLDETTTKDWRKQGFYPVLNEHAPFPEINLNRSVLAKSLHLKHINPQPVQGKLPDEIALNHDRSLQCANLEEFKDFQANHALWGMPYGLPALTENELETLLNWIQDGAKSDFKKELSASAQADIKKWEDFLNANTPKQQLTARYLYEHLYSGDLHIKGQANNEFYKLVRSKTPGGQAIEEIRSVRPFDAPNANPFYYRLRPIVSSIADKDHFVYELSDEKMVRLETLFLKPEYTVNQLPGYDQESAANPFKTFAELPAIARYQFLLDDAEFFFAGFVKGPVSMGNSALTVIRDQFWVAFIKPQSEFNAQTTQFLADNGQYLGLPASKGEVIGFAEWQKLADLQEQYVTNKDTFVNNVLLNQQPIDLNFIWNGDSHNDNALLTVFRHHDNASVTKGLLGKSPLTAWVVDYPLFERIHYLMVAGFNIYGSAAHQATTRLYMDLLRVEAENNFLKFVPANARTAIYDSWYQGIDFKMFSGFHAPTFSTSKEPAISYQTSDIKNEFFEKIQQQLEPDKQHADTINRCQQIPCLAANRSPEQQQTDTLMQELANLRGDQIKALPEVSLLRIKNASADQDSVYTLIRNKKLLNVSYVFAEKLQRQPEQDTLTVVPGFMGSYPNQFFTVSTEQLGDFISQLKLSKNNPDAERFYSQFAIRRTNPDFWQHYDWLNKKYISLQTLNSGILDLSRYENL